MCLFDYNKEDLAAAAKVYRRKAKQPLFVSPDQLVLRLPLSTWKRTVRRVYLPPEEQLARLKVWYDKFILDQLNFVDRSAGTLKGLVRGGKEGMERFTKVLCEQMELVQDGYLSGRCTAEGVREGGRFFSGAG